MFWVELIEGFVEEGACHVSLLKDGFVCAL